MTQLRPRVSYAELERWPSDGRRFELYDGEPFEMPSPSLRHQTTVLNVATIVREHARVNGGLAVIAPFDVIFSAFDVLQPDVVYFSPERVRFLDPDERGVVPPDLAVEVLSPSTQENDRGRKMDLLARYGVREYWLVDPVERTLERYEGQDGVFTLAAVVRQDDVLESRVLPALSVPAARLFGE